MLEIVTLEPERVVVESKVMPPLDEVTQAGTPPLTDSTCPDVPMPRRVFVLAVDERYSISPRVVDGFSALVVVSID